MEEEYTQEMIVDMFKKIRIDNFMIECLNVIKPLIETEDSNIPKEDSEYVNSTIDILKTLGKMPNYDKRLDSYLHEVLSDVLYAEGVVVKE